MEDKEIIQLFIDRSEYSISEIKIKYGGICSYISKNILHNNEDVEECINDTYLAMWNAIPPTQPNPLLAYICKMIRNISMDKLDYNMAKKRNSKFSLSLDELEDCITDKMSVEHHIDKIELNRSINKFLNGINSEKRNIFVRRYWYFDSVSDIAERFCVSESKVKSILMRVRIYLKEHLENDGF